MVQAFRATSEPVTEYGIGRFLEYCVTSGQSVPRQTASNFLSDAHRRHLAPPDGLWEQEVDWFFVNGQQRCAAQPDGVPSIGKADIGKTAWERRMIERLRLQPTEAIYRLRFWIRERPQALLPG